jgi:hypothetical protein
MRSAFVSPYTRRAGPPRGAGQPANPVDMSAHELRAELAACGHSAADLARFRNWTELAAAVLAIRTHRGVLFS